MVNHVDTFDGQQNLDEWIQMLEKTAQYTGWTEDVKFKAALFRLRGEASEFIDQLKTEGKISTWEDIRTALKERFQSSGQDQWYQHLLNTGTQGAKTVQEWAQTVRKLSLLALGTNPFQVEKKEDDEGNEDPNTRAARREADKAKIEAEKAMLNFMRKSNFIRGLKSSLRPTLWRKKCATFDEAVVIACEEERVQNAHLEESVLSQIKAEPGPRCNKDLIEGLVAALDAREQRRNDNGEGRRESKLGQQGRPGNKQRPEREIQLEGEETTPGNWEGTPSSLQNDERASARYDQFNGQRRSNSQQYREQLPLPRGRERVYHSRDQSPEERRRNRPGYFNIDNLSEQEAYDFANKLCFRCHRPGHIKRDCRSSFQPRMSGNGPRRLH